jgi:osmotically inducible protein OsmC
MPSARSAAEASWSGDLLSGSGTVRPGSGAFPELSISWAHRTERSQGATSPEELIAAAHAGCFSMALSNELAKVGHPPERLEVSAAVVFETGRPDGAAITEIELRVSGRVPGADAQAFQRAAEAAKAGCPVSKALTGVTIRLEAATLESA